MMTIRTLVHTMTAVMMALALTAAAGEASGPVSMHPQRRVTLKLLPGDDAAAIARQLAATYRGTLLEPVDGTTSTFDMAVSDAAADRLRMDPRVARVEPRDTMHEVAASPLTLGPYSYDGSGNITQIGSDTFVYDGLHRLESGTADGKRQDYTYDAFGNILTVTTEGDVATKLTLGVNIANNRLSESGAPNNVFGGYDDAGNMTNYLGVDTFEYDGAGMVKESTVDGVHRVYLYSAADERLATLYPAGNAVPTSEWTLRDAGGAVLRRFTKQGTVWRWDQDYIYRGGSLLAADTPGGTQHFHLDHLGTPRLITSNGGVEVARHTYYPFGQEATPSNDPERRRFTGHERDSANLDYMHARYYLPYAGRFLSVDPVLDLERTMTRPQMWNRYSYALNNPVIYTDPTGEVVSLGTLDDTQRQKLLDSLNEFTGNTYGVDDNMNLVLVAYGSNPSATASQFVQSAIDATDVYGVRGVEGDPSIIFAQANQTTNEITIDFKDFTAVNYGRFDPRTFSLGSNLIHELIHTHNGPIDPEGLARSRTTGPVVDYVNQMRAERGFQLRGHMYEGYSYGSALGVPFIIPRNRFLRILLGDQGYIRARNF